MTSQQAQQILASGQGTPDQLAQANAAYYGSQGTGGGAYGQNQSVQNANPAQPTNQPYQYNAPTGQPVPSSITQGIQAGVNSPAAWVGQGQNSYIYDQNYNQASQQYGNQFNPQGFNNYWNALTNGGQPGQFNANAGNLASYMGVNPNSVQIGSGMGQAQLLANQNAAAAGQQLPYANLGTNGPSTYTPGGAGAGQVGNVGAQQPNPQQVMASNGGNGSNGSLNPNQNPPIVQPQQSGILPNMNQQFNGVGGQGGGWQQPGGQQFGGFNSWGNPLQGNPFSYMTGQPNNWSQLFGSIQGYPIGGGQFGRGNPLANSGYGNMGGYLSLLGNMARYPQMQSSPFGGGSFGGMF